MNTVDINDGELASRLRRLEAGSAEVAPGFDYQGMLERHATRKALAGRRSAMARGAAGALVLAVIGVCAWRLDRNLEVGPPVAASEVDAMPRSGPPEQRLVRADTWLALAAIEDHIASIDDALSDARIIAPRGVEVARLERTRAELLDSYARVRYADMVAANF
jgi:hypothetical protein